MLKLSCKKELSSAPHYQGRGTPDPSLRLPRQCFVDQTWSPPPGSTFLDTPLVSLKYKIILADVVESYLYSLMLTLLHLLTIMPFVSAVFEVVTFSSGLFICLPFHLASIVNKEVSSAAVDLLYYQLVGFAHLMNIKVGLFRSCST